MMALESEKKLADTTGMHAIKTCNIGLVTLQMRLVISLRFACEIEAYN